MIRTLISTLATAALMVPLSFAQDSFLIDDYSGGVTAANHPSPEMAGIHYDITSDAFATASLASMPVGDSRALQIDDGGFTNGIYIEYAGIVPFNDTYTVSAEVDIIEDAANSSGIQEYEIGVIVNGAHRDPGGDLAVAEASGEYTATGAVLDASDNSANAPVIIETGTFSASAGDTLFILFSTDVATGNFDDLSGTWGSSAVFVDNLTLNAQTVPVELSVFTTE